MLWKISPELPSYDKIINYKPSLSSRIYSSDGMLLKSFYIQERIFIPINRIPDQIKNAFISAEDKKFYNHFGVDVVAIFRAAFTNIISYNSNRRVVGASTITQQVVKNLLLSNEVSYKRKLKEILLAIRIERILSKDKILELYLNDIYLGYGSYGIGSASLNYFNKSIDQLKLHEIAFLAALPKAPNNYNPITEYKSAIERRNWVIDRMYKNNYIDEKELLQKNIDLVTNKRTSNNFTQADYYFEEIRKNLYNKYGEETLYSKGLVIKTSINTEIQKLSDESLVEGLLKYDKSQGWRGVIDNVDYDIFINQYNEYQSINPFLNSWVPVSVIKEKFNNKIVVKDYNRKEFTINLQIDENLWLLKEDFYIGDVLFISIKENLIIINQVPLANGAIAVINPHNGHVLALSGGFSYKLSEFNRATQAKRQPGSAFKPFVYLTALQEGYTPSTLILDAPYVVDQGQGLPKWKPANYTEEFYGLTTMRTGIEKSRNLMTVRLADKIGMEKILETVKKFGINEGINTQLSMSLGSGLVNLLDLTNSYGIIANGGKKIEPKIITSIYSKDGKLIYNVGDKKCINCKIKTIKNKKIPKINIVKKQVVDSRHAFQITSMMEGVIERGTAKKLSKLNVPIAGKTGTTNDNKDAWFIGYSPDLVIGIYVGYDKPKSLGYKQTGSSVSVPIFEILAKKINLNSNFVPFRIPSGISFVKIDPKTGMSSNENNSILEPYIVGTEPFYKKINIIDTLSNINNNSISGTGGLLDN